MWYQEIEPWHRRRHSGAVILSRTIKTFGFGESTVGELVAPLLAGTNPTLAIYAKTDGIHLRLTAKAPDRKQAEEMLARGEDGVRRILGQRIWGTDGDTLEDISGRLLTERGLTLAVMESCTGGLLAATITDVPGSSTYFRGGSGGLYRGGQDSRRCRAGYDLPLWCCQP